MADTGPWVLMDLDGCCGDSWLLGPILKHLMHHMHLMHQWMDGRRSTCSSFPRNSVTCQRLDDALIITAARGFLYFDIFRIVWLFTAPKTPKTEQQRKSQVFEPSSWPRVEAFSRWCCCPQQSKASWLEGTKQRKLIPQQTLNFPPVSVSSQSYPLVIADIADIAMDNHHFNIGKSSMTEAFSISYVKLPKGKLCRIWGCLRRVFKNELYNPTTKRLVLV